MSTFISQFLILRLQISNVISVPWQSDPFPGKELGHSLKVTRFRERAHASGPETSSPMQRSETRMAPSWKTHSSSTASPGFGAVSGWPSDLGFTARFPLASSTMKIL